MLSVTWSVSHQLGYPASSAARVMAACNQSRLNSKSCPESVRRYGNSSLNATMMLVDCDLARSGRDGGRPTLGCLRREQFPLERIRLDSTTKRMDCIYKLIDIVKALVHGGVTQIGHFIDAAQFLEHFGSNDRRRN